MYTSAFKAWLVGHARVPGVSVSGLAIRHGVNANLLRHWMCLEHWGSPTAAPVLLPVTVTQPEPSAAPQATREGSAPVEIVLGEAIVRVPVGVDLQHLRLVLQALRP
ncbi:transposase [Pseudomonas aeruginosa]|uniref:transposase n=1 Tax=Gammaproteobacteria TaxID=1236 RepID=UPI001231AC36|nr:MULTISPECIES: transposase [Gammaproteobacteria]HBT5887498.1 transposase [Klebsiella quasipneumoniae]HCI6318593.1 transposase [Klebsiella quasipneumoniae subsp. similipneumoniae]KAA5629586.1 transposase [Pseudomonas aeruginosa]MBN9702825.1 transposase [Enterobacter roggenkampii]HBN8507760.1 transposase [Pseudomonas aeruginosa]